MNSKYIAATPADELVKILSDYLKQYNSEFYENTFITHDEAFNRAVITEVRSAVKPLLISSTLRMFLPGTRSWYALLLSEKMGITDLAQAKKHFNLVWAFLQRTFKLNPQSVPAMPPSQRSVISMLWFKKSKKREEKWSDSLCLSERDILEAESREKFAPLYTELFTTGGTFRRLWGSFQVLYNFHYYLSLSISWYSTKL